MVQTDLWDVLTHTQRYVAQHYAGALTNDTKHRDLKNYIEKFIQDSRFRVEEFTDNQLVNRIYSEMVEYSILTPYLDSPLLDEININSWDDITLRYSDGKMKKTVRTFPGCGARRGHCQAAVAPQQHDYR